jgi:hypothetical protein
MTTQHTQTTSDAALHDENFAADRGADIIRVSRPARPSRIEANPLLSPGCGQKPQFWMSLHGSLAHSQSHK